MIYDSNPLVSVCVFVRNGEKTLSKALSSINAQTYKNIELIISNNNSDDDTEKIIYEMMDCFNNVRYIKQKKTLPSIKSVEAVYAQAKGDYLMFAADDDLREPNYIETLLRGYDKYPNSSIVFSDLIIFNKYEKYDKEPIIDYNFRTDGLSFLQSVDNQLNGPFHMYGLIKTQYLSKFKWYDITYGPDHPMLFHLLSQGDFNYFPGTKFYFWKPKKPKSIEERAANYSMREIKNFYKIKLAFTCAITMIPYLSIFELLWKLPTVFFYVYFKIKGGFRGIVLWWK